MKRLLGFACLLWISAAQAQGTEIPVTPAKPLTLQEAWRLAEQGSISLKTARAAVIAAEGHAEDTRGLLWNNPELNAEGLRRKLPPSDLGATTNREWGAGITQALEIAGQHGHRREAARQELIAAQLLAQESEREVRADVEKRFVQVLALQARIGIERDSLALIERTSSFAGKRVAAGEDSRLDGNVALIEAGRARNQLGALMDQLLQARAELGEILQWPSATLPDVVGDLESRATVPALERLLETAADRSQLKALQAKEVAARSKLDLELAARIPDITVGLGVGREGPQDFRENIALLSVSVPLPLFKRNSGNVAQAQADLARAQAERQALERGQGANVRALWHRYQSLRNRVQTLRDAVLPALEENQRLSQQSLREGEIGVPQQVLVNRQLLDGRRDLLEAITELRLTRIALDQIAGNAAETGTR
ncbi:MAG: TolC family protein [Rhizobiaceae bacterium]|nr:TolC family protein [Rhizobiaceae bacterium]